MWKTVKLGDVCELATGGTPSRKKKEYFENGNIKWLVSGDINQREIYDCEGRITDEGLANSNAKYLPENSVLIALNGQGKTRGTVALLRTKATCNQSLVSINPKTEVALDTKFLFYVLDGMYGKIRTMTGDSGNDRRGLNMPLIRSIEIPLPPLAEQQRIVAKLDAAFAEIDRAVEKEQQKIFLTSKMQARLTSSIFSGREHDSSQWKLTALEEVCTATQGVQIPKSKQIQFHQDGYLRYLYISDFRHAKSLKYVEDKYPKKLVSSDDLVMSNTGSQGQIFRGVEGILSNNLFKIGVNKELVNVDYLFEFLKSDVFIEYQDQRTRGTTQPHMGHKNFLSTPILLPPLSIQNEVVMKLHKSNEVFERFFENTSSKTERLHTLKSAILAQELQPPHSEAA